MSLICINSPQIFNLNITATLKTLHLQKALQAYCREEWAQKHSIGIIKIKISLKKIIIITLK